MKTWTSMTMMVVCGLGVACGGAEGDPAGPVGAGGDASTGAGAGAPTPDGCPPGDTAVSNPTQCPAVTGDGYCTHDESPDTAPQDCSAGAGDGVCDESENAGNAPQDCPAAAGDGLCTHGENALSSPDDCPAVAGDGFCTHDETPATAPQDCSSSAGDGVCDADETPASSPADCPPVVGDGLCTHQENAGSAPADCPAVSGDGMCTHQESATSVPADCPAVAGDGACTHSEDAANTPGDCPAVAGDGLCTHTETYDTAPNDCAPPNFTYTGGGMPALKAASPSLTFGNLIFDAPLEFTSTLPVTFTAANITINASFTVDDNPCGTQSAPNVTFDATGTITLDASLWLGGESGTSTTSTATCNSCYGADGGDVTFNATDIYLYGAVDLSGGWGMSSNSFVSGTYISCGCSGGDAGSLTVNASGNLVVDYMGSYPSQQFDLAGGNGGSGNNYCSDGSDGSNGNVTSNPPLVFQYSEVEPNGRKSNCQSFDFSNLVITGAVAGLDSTAGYIDNYYINYSGGPTNDFVEDLYRFSSSSGQGDYTITLTMPPGTNDLDLVVFYNDSLFTYDSGPGTTHSVTLNGVVSGDTIYVGVNRKQGFINLQNDNYTLEMTKI